MAGLASSQSKVRLPPLESSGGSSGVKEGCRGGEVDDTIMNTCNQILDDPDLEETADKQTSNWILALHLLFNIFLVYK